jgi:hypothetical protein
VCEQENCSRKPIEQPSRGELSEEVRFAKKQQWAVATAAVTLLGALYALADRAHPGDKEKIALSVVITLIAILSCSFLVDLQRHLKTKRLELDPADKDPFLRGGAIIGALCGVIILGAFTILYVLTLRTNPGCLPSQ